MNVSVLWDIVSRAKIECGRVESGILSCRDCPTRFTRFTLVNFTPQFPCASKAPATLHNLRQFMEYRAS